MLARVNPSTTSSWRKLQAHAAQMKTRSLRELFAADPQRFECFSRRQGDILLDYSKNLITADTMQLLAGLADDCRLRAAIDAMFRGEAINETENRAVLHTALRNRSGSPVVVGGSDVMPDINRV
ncbi:MAG TPA: glucose-6-phosphate isomerase, partial [bacterium]|nr:glucose-6-phosphate isomerase [bacterium]